MSAGYENGDRIHLVRLGRPSVLERTRDAPEGGADQPAGECRVARIADLFTGRRGSHDRGAGSMFRLVAGLDLLRPIDDVVDQSIFFRLWRGQYPTGGQVVFDATAPLACHVRQRDDQFFELA